MEKIFNIELSYKDCYRLANKLFESIRAYRAEDEEGNITEGILSRWGKASCQVLYELNKMIDLAISPETESAMNYVNTCIPVSVEDCIILITLIML